MAREAVLAYLDLVFIKQAIPLQIQSIYIY
jgi:hypothetical protein